MLRFAFGTVRIRALRGRLRLVIIDSCGRGVLRNIIIGDVD